MDRCYDNSKVMVLWIGQVSGQGMYRDIRQNLLLALKTNICKIKIEEQVTLLEWAILNEITGSKGLK